MNKKRILYVILSILLIWVIFLGLSWDGKDYQLSEDTDMLPASDCAPSVCWDGVIYLLGETVDEEYVKQEVLGKITEVVDLSGMPTENGQSNTPIIPVGSEICPMTIYEKDLAVHTNGEWRRLRY
ncbi:hypothetical protein AALB53_24885 [Lachnospiraceae bacterium 47-T17]